ncbi:hypothetical protein Tco_0248329 [Tanacetum coccineum]
MAVNNLYQPWRAILSMINQGLTGKTSGYDRPRYPVLQMLWGIITSTNVDYAELIWEEFVQAIQTFLTDKANLASHTKKGRKDKPHVIPYCRFTKLIICHLGRTHNIHQRSASPFHLAEEDLRLSNLKFIPKGKEDEVFGMPIPNELISNNIRNAPYYDAYLEMVAKHDRKIVAEQGGKKKPATTKQPKPKPAKDKSSKPAPALKPKVSKEKPSKPSHAKHPKRSKVQKLCKGKPSLQLIDEDEPTQPVLCLDASHSSDDSSTSGLHHSSAQSQAHVGGVAIREPVAEATRPLPVVKGKGKAITTEEQAAQSLLADDTSANIVCDSPSLADAETGADTDKTNNGCDTEILQIGEEQGDDVANVVNLKEKTAEIYKGQVESDPSKTPESRPPPEQVFIDEDQAGPDPGESHSINDKSTEDEPENLNVETEVVSMVTVPIYQASSSVSPLSTPAIDLSPPKPISSTTQAPIFTATTTTIITTLPPPPQQQSTIESEVFTLELKDLPYKIDETVRETVKEAVHVALQAPLRDRFRDLPEANMKEMLHQRMFESGSYKSHLEHVALYEALEASMKRAQRDEFLAEKVKS